ncbi:Hypothetical protein MSYG_1503 [Malassezia sympodialis ATCC 42132]|uniref:Uncharacterized protein n=1 Tax=Malassezia sympodialis (strain ATCC 42132) TaxID=1230383 RepID=A0A1M8A3X3_MALS4|nr:Hypothetical protein MSYG_1503 [Malassezia sympodialis ATCC 42132]
MMQADTIRERGTLHFRGTYVERSHAVPADYCAGKRRDWTVCPGNMSARSCADSCAWEYVLVHELSSDSCPRLYGLPSARAAPLCLELHARARVDLWQNVSENETAWYMKIQGINGAGHHLEWVVRMADEERHVYQCFKAIELCIRRLSRFDTDRITHSPGPPTSERHGSTTAILELAEPSTPCILHWLEPVIDSVSGRRFSICVSPVSPPPFLANRDDRRRSSIISAA